MDNLIELIQNLDKIIQEINKLDDITRNFLKHLFNSEFKESKIYTTDNGEDDDIEPLPVKI
jgi:uncharacterized protein Yka (UPF0111/DUF47 family)